MATEFRPSNSLGNVMPLTEDEVEMSNRKQSLIEIKRWIETEAGFYGRSDEDFLLMFLRFVKFDMEKAKAMLIRYYESRRDNPQWWANRDLKDETTQSILKLKSTIVLMEGDIDQPTVVITMHSRFSEDLTNMDYYTKIGVITFEKVIRRRNSQRNGTVWLVDVKDYKWWITWYLFNPVYGKAFLDCFAEAYPMKWKAVIIINLPFIAVTVIKLMNSFIPRSIRGQLHFYGSNWSSKISEHMPLEVLPEEYGGRAGPMERHENAFVEELMAFNDYQVDDNKYGFQ